MVDDDDMCCVCVCVWRRGEGVVMVMVMVMDGLDMVTAATPATVREKDMRVRDCVVKHNSAPFQSADSQQQRHTHNTHTHTRARPACKHITPQPTCTPTCTTRGPLSSTSLLSTSSSSSLLEGRSIPAR